jgi:hypothetical protein
MSLRELCVINFFAGCARVCADIARLILRIMYDQFLRELCAAEYLCEFGAFVRMLQDLVIVALLCGK